MVPEKSGTTDITLSFWPFFAHVPPNNPKNQNFEKLKTTSGDIIILHKCAKNNDHML